VAAARGGGKPRRKPRQILQNLTRDPAFGVQPHQSFRPALGDDVAALRRCDAMTNAKTTPSRIAN
jgi:hypothetical protein